MQQDWGIMNTDNKIKIDTCLEYLIKANAQPEFIIEIIKKLYDHDNIDYTHEDVIESVYSSFELYRKNLTSPEIITFDELYERARFIVKNNENKAL